RVLGDDELVDVVSVELAVLCAGGGESLADPALVGDLVGVAQQGTPRAVLLDAAALAASARQTARNDAHVADLGTGPEPAAEETSLGHDGATHAGADRQQGHVAAAPPGAEAVLGPARGVGVVVDRDVEARQLGREVGAEGLAAPRDVGR